MWQHKAARRRSERAALPVERGQDADIVVGACR